MRRSVLLVSTLVLTLMASSAAAQVRAGARAGVTADPGQFVMGAHFETREVAPHVSFRPNVGVGVGNDTTLLAVNLDLVYEFPIRNQPWRVLAGGGPAANFWSREGRESEFGGGFNVLVGLEHRDGLMTEVRVGFVDSPSVVFAFGYNFKR